MSHQPFIWSYLRTRDTHTCCRAFGSGSVTTCFYDLGLWRPGIEPRSPTHEANALPLRHRGGSRGQKGPPWLFVVCLFISNNECKSQVNLEITYYFIGLKKVQDFLFTQNILSLPKGLLSRKIFIDFKKKFTKQRSILLMLNVCSMYSVSC